MTDELDFAVLNPPAENEQARVKRTPAGMKNVEFFRRKVIADLMDDLPGPLQDAMREIATAPQLYDNPGFFRMMTFGRVSGKSASDLSEWQLQLKRDYEEWRRTLMRYSPISLSICERICQLEESVDAVRKAESMDNRTVIRMFNYGLNEYGIIRGWITYAKSG